LKPSLHLWTIWWSMRHTTSFCAVSQSVCGWRCWKKRKGNTEYLYSTIYTMHSLKALIHASRSFTCKVHHACLSFVRVHQTAPALTKVTAIQLQLTTHLSTQRDERLSWPGWLIYSRLFTYISGHPSATGQAQDSESSPVQDRRSAAVPRLQVSNNCERHTFGMTPSERHELSEQRLELSLPASSWSCPCIDCSCNTSQHNDRLHAAVSLLTPASSCLTSLH